MTDSTLDFDSVAQEYDAWFENQGRLVFATEVRAFQEILPLLPRPWLEVGIGSGRFAQALGIDTGIDPSAKLLSMAKDRGIKVYQFRGEESFFKEDTFGTVFLIVTLCFVESPLAVLSEAHRILRDDGKVVLGLVLRNSPWGKFYLKKKKQGHRFYKYATFYSYNEVSKLLEQAGFTTVQVISTLFQRPNKLREVEVPRIGYFVEAGFHVLVADNAYREE